MSSVSCLSLLVVGAAAQTPPVLPAMWTAETVDPPQGDGIESYNFVAKPTRENPSTMWSNYTGCQRLIHAAGGAESYRYLLKCDAVNCCKEEQDGNQVEFQIPDASSRTKVQYGGRKTVTNFGEQVEADQWTWKNLFGFSTHAVYTNPCADCVNNVTLVQWSTTVARANITATIQFKNFRGIPEAEAAAFKATFAVPAECQGNILTCDDARSRGLLGKDRF